MESTPRRSTRLTSNKENGGGVLDNTIISLVSTPINNEESNVAPRTPRTRGRRNPVKSPINNNVNQQILEESAINNAKAPSSTNRRGWAAPADADEQNIQENVATTTHQTSWLSNVLNTPRRRAATPPPADAIDNTAASSSSPSVNGDTLHELSSSLASEGLLGRALSSAKKLLTPKPPSRQQMVAQLNEVEEDENERGLITEDFEVYEQQIVEEEDAAEDGVAAVGASSTLEKRKFEINFVQYIWPFMTSLATLLVFLCVSLVKLAVTAFGMLIYRPCHSLADSLLKLPKRYLVIGVVALVSTLALWWNLYAVSSATKWLIHGVGGGMGSLGIPAWLSLLSSASSKKKSLANPPRSSPPSAPKKSNHHHSPNATPTDASPSSSSSALESIINRLSVLESSVNIDSSRESNDVNELKQLVQRMSEMFESIEQRSLFLQDMVDNQSKSYGQLESSMHSRVEDLSKKLHSLDQVVEEGLITLAKEKIASSSPSNMLSSEEKREDLIQIIRETIEVDVNMKQRISDIMESHIKGIKDEIKSLNDANVGRIIDKSLLRYSADVIAKPDYALESAGGAIISELTSSTFCSVWQKESWRIFGVGSTQCKGYGRPSRVAISNDMSVGKCWSMNGQSGQLGIFLSNPIVVEEITIDHIPASIASGGLLGLESAPHQVEAWAVFDRSVFKVDDIDADFYEADSNRRLDDKVFERGKVKAILLGSFQYDIHHDQHIQTFSVSNWAKSRMIKYKLAVRDVVIRFKNNWGNPNYTCIYRVRIHGK